jgi:hypothetical protein
MKETTTENFRLDFSISSQLFVVAIAFAVAAYGGGGDGGGVFCWWLCWGLNLGSHTC